MLGKMKQTYMIVDALDNLIGSYSYIFNFRPAAQSSQLDYTIIL